MSDPNSFSRRLFADFVASRVRAWDGNRDGSSPLMSAHRR